MLKLNVLLLVVLLASCGKSNQGIDKGIPVCIQEILDDADLSSDIKTIRAQENNNELHYWINTDYNQFDGAEYILNMQCDTVCVICGECALPECNFEYVDDWTIIWEK